MGFSFNFSSLYPAQYFEYNFRAVLVLLKTAGSVQTHKSMSFIWIVWSTLYVQYISDQSSSRKNHIQIPPTPRKKKNPPQRFDFMVKYFLSWKVFSQ